MADTEALSTSSMRPSAHQSAYSGLVHLFLELRGRGLSLSSLDLEIVRQWQISAIPIDVVTSVMLEMQEECVKRKQPFPATLIPIGKRLQRAMQRLHEF